MRRTRGAAAVLVGFLLAVFPVAGPAVAHTGKLKLEVASDGATGVTVQATHADGHRLDTLVRLVLTATAEGGRTVGPLQLEPAGEGQGFYNTGPVLAPGEWSVTVSAPAPYKTEVVVPVRARAGQTQPVPAAEVAQPERADSAGPDLRRWWPVGVGVLALAVLTLVPALRRRQSDRV